MKLNSFLLRTISSLRVSTIKAKTIASPAHQLPSLLPTSTSTSTSTSTPSATSARARLFHRFINELPLLLVLCILLWAQYTISISLVINYLISIRGLTFLGLSIWIPFNLFWSSSLINLLRCIITGPGWVERFPNQDDHSDYPHPSNPPSTSTSSSSPTSTSHSDPDRGLQRESNLDQPLAHRPSLKVHPTSSIFIPNSSHPHHLAPRLDVEDHDEDEEQGEQDDDTELEGQDQGSVPLLSQNYRRTMSSTSHSNLNLNQNTTSHYHHYHHHHRPSLNPTSVDLAPRPASTSISPPSYLDPSTIPISNLSFSEQVSRQQQQGRRSSNASDLLNALNFPPLPATSNPNLPDRSSRMMNGRMRRIETLMCKSDGSLRFCRKCNHYKADRSHHCSSCGRCVLRMDHHCPWLGGRCVGLKNHKFFILFLISTSITSMISTISAVKGLMDFVSHSHLITSNSDPRFELAPLNWAFMILVAGLFGMVLTGFTSYHLYLLSANRTTIENMERSLRVRPTGRNDLTGSYALLRTTRLRAREDITMEEMDSNRMSMGGANEEGRIEESIDRVREEAGGLPSYHLPIYKSDDRLTRSERRKLEVGSTKLNLFDLGHWFLNFQQVFGTRSPIYEWFLPLHPKGVSDGYRFEINEENLKKLMDLTSEIRLLPNHRSNELRFERP